MRSRACQFIIIYISNTILYHSNTMRPDVRHKSRSLPILRCKIYQKIGAKFLQEKWRQFLDKQLQLQWPIRQLSKAQFYVNKHSHKKFSVRQNFIIKKEIIKSLQKAEISIAMHKLQQLKSKMAIINQQRGAEMMIMYLECRRKILQELKIGQEEEVLAFIRDKLARVLGDGELYMMKIKCMTILCILLLRFHGILMTPEERHIICKTIELKKKKFLYLDQQQQRQSQFQSLLYLLEQLYKLLFLLKKDQHLILNYYNQLHAYTEIYLQNYHQTKSNIDVMEINKTLRDMKPVISDLNIYEDSKLRKELAVAHIKDEIVEQKQRQFNRRSIDVRNRKGSFPNSFNVKMGSSQKLNSSLKLKLEGSRERKLKIEVEGRQKKLHISAIPEESGHQVMNQLSVRGINFDCLLPIKDKCYILRTNINFRNGFGLVDLTITIEKQKLCCEVYKLKGIEFCLQILNMNGIGSFLEKLFCKLFGSARFFELHNLITMELQTDSYLQELVPAIIRCKAILKQYLRRNYYQEPINGSKFIYPKMSVVELRNEIESEMKEAQVKIQKLSFLKRKGFIQKDEQLKLMQEYIDLKGILVKRMQEFSEYFLFNAHFKLAFKGLDLFSFKDDAQLQYLPLYIKQLKNISNKGILGRQTVILSRYINQILNVHVQQDKIQIANQQYKLEQELQINQQKLKYQTANVQVYSEFKRKNKRTKKALSQFEVIRTYKQQYALFRKQVVDDCVVYKNQKTKICINKSINYNYKLIKKRVRMYNSIKVMADSGTSPDGSFTVLKGKMEQTFFLKFLKHYVFKKKSGFFMVLIYQCPSNQYLYQLIDKTKSFYFTTLEYIPKQLLAQAKIEERQLGKYALNSLISCRGCISEANNYYIKMKNSTIDTDKAGKSY